MFPHQHIRFPSLHVLAHNGPNLKSRSEHGTETTYQMPEAATETASRFLVRVVPLIYGASLGGFANHLWIGLLVGMAITAILDLRLQESSLIRKWLHALHACFRLVFPMTGTKFFKRHAALGHRYPRVSLPDSRNPVGNTKQS